MERLLAENGEIISNIRDLAIHWSESVEYGRKSSQGNFSQGAGSPLLPWIQFSLTVDPEACLFASLNGSRDSEVGYGMFTVLFLLTIQTVEFGSKDLTLPIHLRNGTLSPYKSLWYLITHNDSGWLKTFDDYFREKTQYIFNNTVVKLKEGSRRTFMWSEISFKVVGYYRYSKEGYC